MLRAAIGQDPSLLLKAGLGLVALVLVTHVLARAPRLGLAVLVVPATLATAYVSNPSFTVGGISLYLTDLVSVSAFVVVAARLIERHTSLPGPALPFLGLMLVVIGLALAGAASYSLQPAFNEFRGIFEPLSLLLYVVTSFRRRDDLDWIVGFWIVWAGCLSLIAVAHWLQHGLGTAQGLINVHGEQVTSRGLESGAALAVAMAALLLLFTDRPSTWSTARRQVLALWYLVVVVLTQQRTVWVATALAVLVGLAMDRQRRGRLTARFTALGYAGLVTAVGIALAGAPLARDFTATWRGAYGANSTVQWRATGWQELLHTQLTTWTSWMFGRPFGLGYAREIGPGGPVVVEPHNYYVNLLIRGGIVGLLLLAIGLLLAWRRLGSAGHFTIALRLILLTQAVYFMSYSFEMTSGILVGLAVVAPQLLAAQVQEEPAYIRMSPRTAVGGQSLSTVIRLTP